MAAVASSSLSGAIRTAARVLARASDAWSPSTQDVVAFTALECHSTGSPLEDFAQVLDVAASEALSLRTASEALVAGEATSSHTSPEALRLALALRAVLRCVESSAGDSSASSKVALLAFVQRVGATVLGLPPSALPDSAAGVVLRCIAALIPGAAEADVAAVAAVALRWLKAFAEEGTDAAGTHVEVADGSFGDVVPRYPRVCGLWDVLLSSMDSNSVNEVVPRLLPVALALLAHKDASLRPRVATLVLGSVLGGDASPKLSADVTDAARRDLVATALRMAKAGGSLEGDALSALCHFYDQLPGLASSTEFWAAVHTALEPVGGDPLTRKRALHLVTRGIDTLRRASSDKRTAAKWYNRWRTFVVIMEGLAEYAGHLVKSVWPRMSLILPQSLAEANRDDPLQYLMDAAATHAGATARTGAGAGAGAGAATMAAGGGLRRKVVPSVADSMSFYWTRLALSHAFQHANVAVTKAVMTSFFSNTDFHVSAAFVCEDIPVALTTAKVFTASGSHIPDLITGFLARYPTSLPPELLPPFYRALLTSCHRTLAMRPEPLRFVVRSFEGAVGAVSCLDDAALRQVLALLNFVIASYGRGYERSFLPGFASLLIHRTAVPAVSFQLFAAALSAVMPAVPWRARLVEWANASTEGGSNGTRTTMGARAAAEVAYCVDPARASDGNVSMSVEAVAHACALLRSDVEFEKALAPVMEIAGNLYSQPYLNADVKRNVLLLLRGVLSAEAAFGASEGCVSHTATLSRMLEPVAPSLCAYLQQRITSALYDTDTTGLTAVAVLQAGIRACTTLPSFAKAGWAVLRLAGEQLSPADSSSVAAQIQIARALYCTCMLAEHVLACTAVAVATDAGPALEGIIVRVMDAQCEKPEGVEDVFDGATLEHLRRVAKSSSGGPAWTTWSQLTQAAASWRFSALAAILAAVEARQVAGGVVGDVLSLECCQRVARVVAQSLGTCTRTSAPPLLMCLRYLLSLPGVLPPPADAGAAAGTALLDLRAALQNAWTSVMDFRPHPPSSIQCLCAVITHPALFQRADFHEEGGIVRSFLEQRIGSILAREQPVVVQFFTAALLYTLQRPGCLATVGRAYSSLLCSLVVRNDVTRNAEDDPLNDRMAGAEHIRNTGIAAAAVAQGRMLDVPDAFPRALLITRVQVLVFLETVSQRPEATELVSDLAVKLLEPLLTDDMLEAGMPGSDIHSVKLRSMQAVAVMVGGVSAERAAEVFGLLLRVTRTIQLSSVREYVDMSLISLANRFPAELMPAVFEPLKDYDLVLQPTSSLLFVGVQVLSLVTDRVLCDPPVCSPEELDALKTTVIPLYKHVFPWLLSTSATLRGIAGVGVLKLSAAPAIQELLSQGGFSMGVIHSMMSFLTSTKLGNLLRKQRETFAKYRAGESVRVVDVLTCRVNTHEDLVPEYILDEVKEATKTVMMLNQMLDRNWVSEYRRGDEELFLRGDLHKPTHTPLDEAKAMAAAHSAKLEAARARVRARIAGGPVSLLSPAEVEDSLSATFNFQRKIQPWEWMAMDASADGKDLAYRNSAPVGTTTARDAAGRACQPLIVVASFIDKATNLGGLTRTCEIFSAESLVIGDEKFVRDRSFKQLCVGAHDWMPIHVVPPSKVVQFLQAKRRDGYAVVGLEQTSRSQSIEHVKFPDKVVVVLGAEKEGIPVEVIQELDIVVEIPQFGIIRSLNVHVSGALLVWQYTQQRLLRSQAAASIH